MINPQRYEAETDLTVDAAHAIGLHPVEKKHEQCHNPGGQHQDGENQQGQLQIRDCVFFSISRRSVEFADGSVRAGF